MCLLSHLTNQARYLSEEFWNLMCVEVGQDAIGLQFGELSGLSQKGSWHVCFP